MWPGRGECGGTVRGQVVVSVEELYVARSGGGKEGNCTWPDRGGDKGGNCMWWSHCCVCVCSLRRSCAGEDRRTCYITILPSPPSLPSTLTPTLADNFSLHFKFDLLAPFPAFIPSLSLKIPGQRILTVC